MHGSGPAPATCLFRRQANEVQIVPTEELSAAVGARRPGERRNCVDDQCEVALAVAERVLCALALVDVRQDDIPAGDPPIGTAQRKPTDLTPPVDAIEPPDTCIEII